MLTSNSHRILCCATTSLLLLSQPVYSQSLPDLVRLAVQEHPTIAAANASIAAAQAGVETANWQYYPNASVSVEYADAESSDVDYAGDSVVTQLTIEQPLWKWGGIDAGVSIAETQVVIEQTRKKQEQWKLAESVIEAYGKWAASYLNLRAWESGLEDHEELLRQVEKRVNQGVSASIDLALAEGRVASTEAEYLASKTGLRTALQELGHLTNSKLLNGDLVDHLSAPQELNFTDDVQAAQAMSPSVQLAIAEVHLSEQQIVEQQASLKPAVYLRAQHQLNSFSQSNAAPKTRVFIGMSGSTGAGLSWQSQLKGSEALLLSKQANLETVRQSTEQAIEILVINIESIKLRLDSLVMAMGTSDDVSESYKRQFLAGRKSWQEVI